MSAAFAIDAFDVSRPVDPVDMSALMRLLSRLDDRELVAVEDDLNLFHFTGIVSERLQPIFDDVLSDPL